MDDNGNPWLARNYFYPFRDRNNKRRFLLDRIYGLVALFATFNYMRVFGQVLFASDPRGPGYIYGPGDMLLFYGQYLLAFLPLAVWIILLTINGMTLFSETVDGQNRIHNWIAFRAELAWSYLGWFLFILLITPFPGAVLSTILYWSGQQEPWRIFLAPLSVYLLFPILFLSVALAERPFELFYKPVWKSLVTHTQRWLFYYLTTIPILLVAFLLFGAGIVLTFLSIPRPFWIMQIPFLIGAALLGQGISWLSYLYFRLLGALGWTAHWE